jgi:hypothetical protein
MGSVASPNTANTLSVKFSPGQEKRLAPSNSEAIFTFGDFNIERNTSSDSLTSTTLSLHFGGFSTLNSLGSKNFTAQTSVFVNSNELRLKSTEPKSYTYFGSFYTDVANSINNIISNFPYAILAYDNGTGTTIFNYSQSFNNTTGSKTSTFRVPLSGLTNQGGVIINSGITGGAPSLVYNPELFSIQLSATSTNASATTEVHDILNYFFSGGSYLEFTINGFLFTGSQVTSTYGLYIRPSSKRLGSYKMNLSSLERQVLLSGNFLVPDINLNDNTQNLSGFTWPTTIDGFNPDSMGGAFDAFQTSILQAAANIDETKTNILVKTVIGENYIELDSDSQVFKTIVQSYAHQFDEIKRYIDGLAFAHSINYSGEESVPNKFLAKFSNLLGWKLSSSFSEIDLFKYLAGDEDGQGNSLAQFNIEIWKRILVNINWLFKKKGTRDALIFLFKLLGAPDCLITLDEIVYDINQVYLGSLSSATNASLVKINNNGYINYNGSQFAFQEGGDGRGDGQNYINQWRPEFDPQSRVDNIKVYTGDTNVFGTQNVINSKELCAALDPASAIECDVKGWYQLSGTCWVWGSLAPPFSANTTPFYYTIPNCEFVAPNMISGMTLSQYTDFIYMSNVGPKNRKTNNQIHTSWHYPELRRIYLNYYLLSQPQSHQLTFKKLEAFLNLLETQVQDYVLQLIPATTILDCQGTIYRNTVFNRQRFVYREGINAGSEFQVGLPPNIPMNTTPIQISSIVNNFISPVITPLVINMSIAGNINAGLTPVTLVGIVNPNNISSTINTFSTAGNMNLPTTLSIRKGP